MFFSGPWHIGLIKDAGGADIESKWAVAPIPKKDSTTSFVGGCNMVVFKDSKNKDAAWAFLQFLSDPATQAKWYTEATDLPAVQARGMTPRSRTTRTSQMFGEQLKDTQGAAGHRDLERDRGRDEPDDREDHHGRASPAGRGQEMQQQAQSIGTGS